MIFKSFALFFLFLTVYALIVPVLPKGLFLTQWQGNVIKAEKFLLEEGDHVTHVVVGSSLTNRLVFDSLPGVINLGLDGLSIFDGLSVVEGLKIPPKYLYVEINNLIRKPNQNFLDATKKDVFFLLREKLPVFRTENKPFTILVSKISDLVKAIVQGESKPASGHGKNQSDEFFRKMLRQQMERNDKRPPDSTVTSSFERLKSDLEKFETRGTKIVLFEMPVDPMIRNLSKPLIIRQNTLKYFSGPQYLILFPDKQSDYKTTDGVHLTNSGALKFTIWFRRQVELNLMN